MESHSQAITTQTAVESGDYIPSDQVEYAPSSSPGHGYANAEKQLYPELQQDNIVENEKSPSQDEPPVAMAVNNGHNFWSVNGYKKTVKRIDDGAKLCDDMMKLVSERAEIEASYMNKLKAWSKKWDDSIIKGAEYGSAQDALKTVISEAEQSANVHNQVYDDLLKEVYESVLNWKKNNYHKSMLSWKETKAIEEGFAKGQKPWGKKFDEVNKCKKAYYAAHVSHNQAVQAEADSKLPEKQLTDEQLKKLKDKVSKTSDDVTKTREKYRESLRDITTYNPKFEEDMKYWFEKAQEFEKQRKDFVKEALVQYHKVVEKGHVAERFSAFGSNSASFNKTSTLQDLEWFAQSFGSSMPIHWPEFEEYNPDTMNTSTSTAPKDSKITSSKESPEVTSGNESAKTNKAKSGICTTL